MPIFIFLAINFAYAIRSVHLVNGLHCNVSFAHLAPLSQLLLILEITASLLKS